jgi:hypothetical protein
MTGDNIAPSRRGPSVDRHHLMFPFFPECRRRTAGGPPRTHATWSVEEGSLPTPVFPSPPTPLWVTNARSHSVATPAPSLFLFWVADQRTSLVSAGHWPLGPVNQSPRQHLSRWPLAPTPSPARVTCAHTPTLDGSNLDRAFEIRWSRKPDTPSHTFLTKEPPLGVLEIHPSSLFLSPEPLEPYS